MLFRSDDVLVRSHVAELSPATCRIVQRAFRDETLLCEARVRVAFVAPNGRPRRQPRDWMAAFQTITKTPEGQEPA